MSGAYAQKRLPRLMVAALPFVLIAVLLASGGQRAMAADCADGVVVLGARGSGESATDPPSKLGPEIDHAYNNFRDGMQRRGVRVRLQAVEYPAEGVPTALLGPAGVDIFVGSIAIGVNNAITQLLQIQNGLRTNPACAGPRIVLAGFSQGAMVMHRVLEELHGGTGVYTELLGRIGAVLLIADGDKMPGDTSRLYPLSLTAQTQGIGAALAPISQASAIQLPADLRDRVYSVCLSLDVVCDFTNRWFNTGLPFLVQANLGIGTLIHMNAYRTVDFGAVGAVVDRVANEIRNIPLPPATTTTTTTAAPTTPPSDGLPQGNCRGQTDGKDYYIGCLVVRRNNEIAADYHNVRAIIKNEPPNVTYDKATDRGVMQLRAIGLDMAGPDPICPAPRTECHHVVGTPTGAVGVYPLEIQYATATTPVRVVTWYVEIVA